MTSPRPQGGQRRRRVRSWMFVPGNRQRFLDKCAELPVDAVILDLEDGVTPDTKPLARDQIVGALDAGRIRAAAYVRINEVGSPWYLPDIQAVLHRSLTGVVLPKVESAHEVADASNRIAQWEADAGVDVGSISILAAVESAKGLLAAPEIAAAPRVEGLMLGSEDFSHDLGLAPRREREAADLVYARSAMVVAARSAGGIVIDGVFPDYQDIEGLLADVGVARRLGFDGKSLFHPGQIEEINRAFSPTEDELSYARQVVDAFDEATARGDGAVAVGGQLVDLPIVLRARQVLETAEE